MRSYFKRKEFKGFPQTPTIQQSFLLANLTNMLNMIRRKVGVPMTITSCCRDAAKYQELVDRGYHPSPTSDHFWGYVIPTLRTRDKAKYGDTYKFSVGAVDFVCKDIDNVFNTIMDMVEHDEINIGQCILEKGKNSKWIHISNPKEIVYAPGFIKKMSLEKIMFLTSNNNGKSYKRVER